MYSLIKNKIYKLLRYSEKWTKTDMVYLAKGGFWMSGGQIISALSGFALAIAFANLVDKNAYGHYKYAISIISLLLITALPGMGTALVQAVARGYEGTLLKALKIKIKWSLIGSLISVGLFIYYYFQSNSFLAYIFLLSAFFIPLFDNFKIINSYLNGKKLFKFLVGTDSAAQTFSTLSIIITLFLTRNILLIILVYLAANSFARIINFYFILKKIPANKKDEPGTINYGKHLTLIGLLTKVSDQLDKLLLWHYVGAAELAIYAFSIALPNQIRVFFKALNPLAQPKLAATDAQTIKKTLPLKLFKLSLLMGLVIIIYIALAPLIFKYIFPQYLASVFYSQLYMITLLFFSRNLISATLTAKVQKKKLYFLSLTSQVLKIALLFILIPQYHILGIIFTEFSVNIYNYIVSFILLKKI